MSNKQLIRFNSSRFKHFTVDENLSLNFHFEKNEIYGAIGSTEANLIKLENGGRALTTTIVEKTSTYNVNRNEVVWADASGGDFSITFPLLEDNIIVGISNVGESGIVTADGNGEDIDGGDTTFELTSGESLTWRCNGTKWVAF